MNVRELTADELAAATGGLVIDLNFGLFRAYATLTDHGVSGGVKVGDGKWHSGAIFFDDLPK